MNLAVPSRPHTPPQTHMTLQPLPFYPPLVRGSIHEEWGGRGYVARVKKTDCNSFNRVRIILKCMLLQHGGRVYLSVVARLCLHDNGPLGLLEGRGYSLPAEGLPPSKGLWSTELLK